MLMLISRVFAADYCRFSYFSTPSRHAADAADTMSLRRFLITSCHLIIFAHFLIISMTLLSLMLYAIIRLMFLIVTDAAAAAFVFFAAAFVAATLRAYFFDTRACRCLRYAAVFDAMRRAARYARAADGCCDSHVISCATPDDAPPPLPDAADAALLPPLSRHAADADAMLLAIDALRFFVIFFFVFAITPFAMIRYFFFFLRHYAS